MELNTEITSLGVVLTFNDGRKAGLVWYRNFNPSGWLWLAPEGVEDGPRRRTREAAEYDALAWACDQEAGAVEQEQAS